MRRQIVASSWKMHINSIEEGQNLSQQILNKVGKVKDVEIFILPTYPLIQTIKDTFKDSNIGWGAQNVCFEEKGAYTGEVPAKILKEIGCKYIEIGHAERKSMFGENNSTINKKVKICEKYDLIPVVCIGETQEDIDNNVSKVSIKSQILWAMEGINQEFRKKMIIAYEPVWAIGKEKAADAEFVQNNHKYIRDVIKKEYGNIVSDEIRIIYGGSVSPISAPDLIKHDDVDGLFIGRFGLDGENFKSIVESTVKATQK